MLTASGSTPPSGIKDISVSLIPHRHSCAESNLMAGSGGALRSTPCLQQTRQNVCRFSYFDKFVRRERGQVGSQVSDTPFPPLLQQLDPLGGGPDAQAAGVLGVGGDFDQPAARQAGHD